MTAEEIFAPLSQPSGLDVWPGQYEPTVQISQALAPNLDWNLPASQSVQDACPAAALVPAAHGVGATLPVGA